VTKAVTTLDARERIQEKRTVAINMHAFQAQKAPNL